MSKVKRVVTIEAFYNEGERPRIEAEPEGTLDVRQIIWRVDRDEITVHGLEVPDHERAGAPSTGATRVTQVPFNSLPEGVQESLSALLTSADKELLAAARTGAGRNA